MRKTLSLVVPGVKEQEMRLVDREDEHKDEHRRGGSLMRPQQVANELQVSVAHVYRLIASGELPGVRIGRSVRVSPARLQEWLRQQGA